MQVTVDGAAVEIVDGGSVLDAVLAAGVELPHLCKDADAPPIGACRTCLVEVEGVRGLPASCSLPAAEGMAVRTRAPGAVAARRSVLELTLAMQAEAAEPREGELVAAAAAHGAELGRWTRRANPHVDESNHFYRFDASACILCGRCTVACNELQHIGAIGIAGTGKQARIAPFGDEPLGESTCTSCGQCVAACPTEALVMKRTAPLVRTVSTVCPYCGVGCGIRVSANAEDELVHVDDDPANRSSLGLLCVKGRFGTAFVNHPERLTQPLIRKEGSLQPASWEEALDLVAERFAAHRGAFGAFASAKATNEDNYLIQKFVRAVMGTNNIDHCTRLCHSPSVEAMLAQLGSGATSNSYTDYEEAGCLLVVGADPSSNHPVVASRMRRAIHERGTRLVVLNPKRIEMCDHAELWLRQYPGTDVAVLNGMARVVLEDGLWDEAFVEARTEGFGEWRASVEEYTPERVEELSGVPAAQLVAAARLYARPESQGGRPGSCLVWGMGVTQHTNGTANATALLNLSLVTGQLGGVGNGVSPLRGQNNVQGAGDAGCVPDSLPGYQPYAVAVLERFGEAWGAELPSEEGLRATEMVERILTGEVRCMYVVGENPALTDPNLAHATEALQRLDFLVVQDIFMHETGEIADVVLPAASFAEKEGTFTNSERRVQRVRQVIPPVGGSRADWEIVQEIAQRTAARLGVAAVGFRPHERGVGVRRDGVADADDRGAVARAAGPRGRDPVALPDAGPRGDAALVREGVPARTGAVRAGAAVGAERGGAGRALPVHPQHGAGAVPLARGDADAPGGGAAGELPGAAGDAKSAGRGAAGGRGWGGAGGGVAAGAAGGGGVRDGGCGAGVGVRAVREAEGERGELADEQCLRPGGADSGVQGLRGAGGAGGGSAGVGAEGSTEGREASAVLVGRNYA